jgi:hypothetical protein
MIVSFNGFIKQTLGLVAISKDLKSEYQVQLDIYVLFITKAL